MNCKNTFDQVQGASTTVIETEIEIPVQVSQKESLEARTENLTVELEKYQSEIRELTAKCERLKRDFKNYKDRIKRDETRKERNIRQTMAVELLGGLDSLDRARSFKSSKRRRGSNAKVLDDVRENLTMTYEKTISVLGLEKVAPSSGDMFDEERHVALDVVNNNDYPDDTIVKLIRKGYLFDGKLVRPAEVILSKYGGEEETKRTMLQRMGNRLRSIFIKD